MPKNSLKFYSGNPTKPELQELSKQHGLTIADEQGKFLNVEKLRGQLDELAARKSGPTLGFGGRDEGSTNEEQSVVNQALDNVGANATADAGSGNMEAGAATEPGSPEPAEILASSLNLPDDNATVSLDSVTAEPPKLPATAAADDANGLVERHTAPTGPLYLQLNVRNLGYYLSRGIVYPLVLEPDRDWNAKRPTDSLTKTPDFLPFSPGRLPDFAANSVLVEAQLLPDEMARLSGAGTHYAWPEPLPVSRIRRVFFATPEAMADFKANADTYDNYFFPVGMCEVISDQKVPLVMEAPQPADAATVALDPAWAARMRQFDRQLGLFAYLKHAPLLRANAEGYVQDFPAELLVGLQLLNGAFEPVANVNKLAIGALLRFDSQPPTTAGQLLFGALIQAIYADEEASFSWALALLRRVENQCAGLLDGLPPDIQQVRVAQEQIGLLQVDKTNFQNVLLAIAQSDGSGAVVPKVPFAALVLLAKYPDRARKAEHKQSVLSYLARSADQDKLKVPALDQLLAVLGLYYGYAQLTRKDPNLTIKDPALAAAALPLHRLRFDIGGAADRTIVETVFRFVVEGQPILDNLAYLHLGSPTSPTIRLPQRSFGLATGGVIPQPEAPAPPVAMSSRPTLAVAGQEPAEAIYQEIIRKMMGWLAPAPLELLLAATFTPAEREVLRRLQRDSKSAQ